MRLALIALSTSYCVDALLAASTSAKVSSHSWEAARRSAAVICRDGFFDSVTEQCNA